MKKVSILACIALIACSPANNLADVSTPTLDLSQREKPTAITQDPWTEVVINVERFDDIAPFFQQIGEFETFSKTETELLLKAKGSESGFVRLIQIGKAEPARPADSRAWDKGCYFSIMMRAKNLPSIIADSQTLGWEPLTDLAYLEFGPSKLNVIVLTHKSGVRVQLYERLTTALPEGFTPFDRISRPFNIMQMVEDRDAGYDFFQQKLGFDTFFYGKPYVSEKEEVMPLGIPPRLTTTTPYMTGIMTPKAGVEYGRMEMIDIEQMPDGVNYADRCKADHTGIVEVRFEVPNLADIQMELEKRGAKTRYIRPQSNGKNMGPEGVLVRTPDGANIRFIATKTE